MDRTALVLLVIAVSATAYLAAVWFGTESKAIRVGAVLAMIGSVLLFLDAILNSLCRLSEDRSELFDHRCQGPIPEIPLFVIPLLLALPFLRHFVSGPLLLALGVFLVAAAIAVPMQLLSV